MQIIELSAIPNQTFSIRLDNDFYNITIKETNGCMSCDIERSGVQILQGIRIVSNYPIIPYQYLENGNFVITTLNDDLPYYDQFGISQFLYFASESELETIRGSV